MRLHDDFLDALQRGEGAGAVEVLALVPGALYGGRFISAGAGVGYLTTFGTFQGHLVSCRSFSVSQLCRVWHSGFYRRALYDGPDKSITSGEPGKGLTEACYQLSVLYKSFTILHEREKNSKYSKLRGEE